MLSLLAPQLPPWGHMSLGSNAGARVGRLTWWVVKTVLMLLHLDENNMVGQILSINGDPTMVSHELFFFLP